MLFYLSLLHVAWGLLGVIGLHVALCLELEDLALIAVKLAVTHLDVVELSDVLLWLIIY